MRHSRNSLRTSEAICSETRTCWCGFLFVSTETFDALAEGFVRVVENLTFVG